MSDLVDHYMPETLRAEIPKLCAWANVARAQGEVHAALALTFVGAPKRLALAMARASRAQARCAEEQADMFERELKSSTEGA